MPRMSKTSSLISPAVHLVAQSSWAQSNHRAAAAQVVEEAADRLPDLLAAGEALPVQADQRGQLVRLVDRDQVALETVVLLAEHQGLDVGHEALEGGVGLDDLQPRLEVQYLLMSRGTPRLERVHSTTIFVLGDLRGGLRDVAVAGVGG